MVKSESVRPHGTRRPFVWSWWFWAPVLATVIAIGLIPSEQQVNLAAERREADPAAAAAMEQRMEQRATQRAEQAARDQRAREEIWMERGKNAVRARLKDPGSARFENVFFHDSADGPPVACGYVNSRNSFGGYSGAQRFVATDQMAFLEEEVAGDFGAVWAQMCR